MNKEKKYGWDFITEEFLRVYPNQDNPIHYGTLIDYKFGGKDPLRGISIYEGSDAWHFVTYGLSEIYEKETSNKDVSGYGMEFTLRLKKDDYENLESEFKCICNILQEFAKLTFTNGEIFRSYEYLYTGQETGIDALGKSNITGFITIPDSTVKSIETINGRVEFVEFVGVTDKELKSIINKEITVKELYQKLDTDMTNYNRNSII